MAEIMVYSRNPSAAAAAPHCKKGRRFTRKCASLIQEQRAKIYVLRRCATMLLCWYIQGDD
ncbi:Small polypeptide DEVIL 22 [Linum perenne]